jgi:hypothetical protein
MRGEPEDSLVWGERARPCTIGTFNQLHATVEKTLEFDGNRPRKHAFGCFARLHLFAPCSSPFRCALLDVRWHSFLFWFRLSCMLLRSVLRWRSFDARSFSINNPKRIATEHKKPGCFLQRLCPHVGFPSQIAPLQSSGPITVFLTIGYNIFVKELYKPFEKLCCIFWLKKHREALTRQYE